MMDSNNASQTVLANQSRMPEDDRPANNPFPQVCGNCIDVLYIAGEGRSGSTIVGNLIGEFSDFFHAGELRYIWKRGLLEDQSCGCGRKFSACPFWVEVLKNAFGSRSGIDLKAMLLAAHKVSRVRRRPLKTMFSEPPMENALLTEYIVNLTQLYNAIHIHCGQRIIIDSSKSPYYLFVLNNVANIRLHVLHLVRDPRAVAFSRSRRKENFEADPLSISNPHRSARKWVESNRAVRYLLDHIKANNILVRYEDFISAPDRTLESIHKFLGLSIHVNRFSRGYKHVLKQNHTVWGNPCRFNRGPVELRVDNKWRTWMPWHESAWVTLYTFRLRSILGY